MFNIFKKKTTTDADTNTKSTSKYNEVYGYDFDGVISIGITPRSESDVIITGRCIDEQDEIKAILKQRGIKCKVYFNPMTLAQRGNHTVEARTFSGIHKASTINKLLMQGVNITRFFEDDPIQYQIIQDNLPKIQLVNVVSKLVQK
jgi:hypothetical protein